MWRNFRQNRLHRTLPDLTQFAQPDSCRRKVTFAEAALGGDIEVPTIDGAPVTLRLRPGTPSGSRHRVKGKGITVSSKRDGEPTGDMIVTVEVDVPAQLTDEQRAAVELLAAATTVSPRTTR